MSREIPIVIRTESGGLRMPSLFTIAALLAMAFSAFIGWRWFNGNVLSLGIHDGDTTVVNQALLLEKVRAFEVVSIKHTYETNVSINAGKDLNLGVTDVGMPTWLAGQKMQVNGKVQVTAGADLSQVKPEDIVVARQGRDVQVTIFLPPPQLLSAEPLANTIDIETSQGLLTRARTRIGFSEDDLKDGALDRLMAVAKDGAVKNGLLNDAQRETQWRLEGFLNSLPRTGDSHVTYIVKVRQPSEV
jgi:hypothetical protein